MNEVQLLIHLIRNNGQCFLPNIVSCEECIMNASMCHLVITVTSTYYMSKLTRCKARLIAIAQENPDVLMEELL